MDTKKQGFFSALREEVARGLSPARARRRSASNAAEVAAALRVAGGAGEALAPLMEGPDPEAVPGAGGGARRNDLRLLLGVMGAPLAPVHVSAAEPLPHLSIKDTPIVRTKPRRCSLPAFACVRVLALDWAQLGAR